MTKEHRLQQEDLLLYLAGYLTLGAMAIVGWNTLEHSQARWAALALLLSFAVLLAAQALVLQHSYLQLYLAIQTAITSALLMLAPGDSTLFALPFFILSAQAMTALPQRRGLGWLGLFTLITAAIFFYGWGTAGILVLLPHAAGYFFFGAFASALKRAADEQEKSAGLLARLQEAHQQLQEYATRAEELAIAEERNRMAREMHDTLGHRLTVSVVQLEGAQRLIANDPQRAATMVATVREQVREALGDLRRTVAALRVPLEADLSLPQSLRRLATGFEEATGLTVHLLVPRDMPQLPDPHRHAIFRTAQEAMTNAQRHASAQQIWLQLAPRPQQITLLVSDDGVGLPAELQHLGFGLRGLHERAQQLGGDLFLGARPGGGTQLSLALPLAEESAHD